MATRRTSRRTATSGTAQPSHNIAQRVRIEYMDINDITPYEWNPRDNAEAVKSVAASIQSFGFAIPVVVDARNVLIAGHTRIEAAKTLGITEVPVVRASYLSPEQANAFRVIDNKVAEQAKWDFELLAGEIQKLEGLDIDFTQYGWSQADLDCMSQLVAADCLSTETLAPAAQQAVATGHTSRRAPQHARGVIGDFVFFIPMEQYRNWSEGVRQLNDFNEERIVEDLKRRLGMPLS